MPGRSSRARTAALVVLPPLALVLAFVVTLRAVYAGRVLPGTSTAGLTLSGDEESEARDRLAARAQRPLVLVAGERRFELAPRDAGVALDVTATTRRVMDAGRSGPLFGIGAVLRGFVRTRDVAPVVRVENARLRRSAATVAARVGRRADDGALVIEATTLAVSTRRPRDGRSVDRPLLERRMRRAVRRGLRRVEVPVRVLDAASAADVRAVAREAQAYLERPLRLRAAGRRTEVTPARLARVLRLEPGRDGPRLGSDQRSVRTLVREVAARVDRPARDPRFSVPQGAGATLDGKGDVSWRPRRVDVDVTPGRSGRQVATGRAVSALRAALRGGAHDATLPTQTIRPAVTATAARRVRFVIGTFTTRYAPGQPRVQNIRRIARAVDGTVVAPGRSFSLNGVSGPRTLAKGYVEAPFIADGKIEPSVGGGVSQFSTTAYNAAFFAGLRLDSSQPHSLYIDRYPPGREATLNFPDIDLRFTNDTEAPVLVRASSTATSVTVTLFGDNGRRRTRALAGPRRPVPGGDFAITVTREVRFRDGRTLRQPRTVRYDLPVQEP